ncbi:MAG: GNAT family N-acetyltransferase [Acidobacteriaceae bacterium]
METARLVLRPLLVSDEDALAEVYCDAETMRWYPAPYTREQLRDKMELQRGRYASGTGLLGMVEKRTGKLIGDCGIVWQEVEATMEPEIGYHVHRGCWGQGFATEAAKAMIDHAFEELEVDHVISLIRPENLQSRRVAEKNGLTLDRVVLWRDFDHCVYKLWK